jgi:hypothetical protein
MANPLSKVGEILKLYHIVEKELQHATQRIEKLETLNLNQDERVRILNDKVISIECDRQNLVENCRAAAATTATNIFAKNNGSILERLVRVEMKLESLQGFKTGTETKSAESLLQLSSADITRRTEDKPVS